MIPSKFEFRSPNSVAEALEVYGEFQGKPFISVAEPTWFPA